MLISLAVDCHHSNPQKYIKKSIKVFKNTNSGTLRPTDTKDDKIEKSKMKICTDRLSIFKFYSR